MAEENFWVSAKWESGSKFNSTPDRGDLQGDVLRWGSGQFLRESVLMAGGHCVNARLGSSDEYYANVCTNEFYFLCEF